MKKIFYAGIAGLVLFEIASVYFIMPMPGSQRMNSLGLAYFLYHWRWLFRGGCGLLILGGLLPAFRSSKWWALTAAGVLAFVVYQFNFELAAEKMFYPPRDLRLADAAANQVNLDKLVLGVEINGKAKAYPLQFIGYHHQVRDEVDGIPVLITYCTVCRSGRAYSPVVGGLPVNFRLVGMDHFNAMLEDARTCSWWRQATGEAVAGPLKGEVLPEFPTVQTSLREWLALYPESLVMQSDSAFSEEYAHLDTYDTGLGRGKLTGTDTLSWKDKSWVVGIVSDGVAKAYDWNRLKRERLVNDRVGRQSVVLVLAADNKSFFAFERPEAVEFSLQNDTLFGAGNAWHLNGLPLSERYDPLRRITAYQEFWHSWNTFHPRTTRY